jgi:hypothetical protein
MGTWRHRGRVAAGCGLAPVLALTLASCAWMGRTSDTFGPAPVAGNAASRAPAVSQGGRYVAFESAATDLVPGDTNGATDVFLRDHVARTTERVSVGAGGAQGNGPSRAPAVSDDGRFVAFETDASNLVAGDGDDDTDIVVHDRATGTTTLVSVDVPTFPPVLPGDIDATTAAISGDGTRVAFRISAAFTGGCCAPLGPYVRNLAAATTTAMPAAPGGGLAWGRPTLSDDGGRIAYAQIGPPDTLGNATYGAVVADTAAASVVRVIASGQLSHQAQNNVEVALAGDGASAAFLFLTGSRGQLHRFTVGDGQLALLLDGLAGPSGMALSDDGQVIALRTADGYVVTDAAGAAPRVVSADPLDRPATGPPAGGDLSGDGRFVTFASADDALIADDANGVDDVYLRAVNGTAGPS